MSNVQQVHIGEVMITTHIITTVTEVDQSLSDLLSTARNEHAKGVIGLDIEEQYSDNISLMYTSHPIIERVAVLILYSDTSCLIIKLPRMSLSPSVCRSVSKFLQLQELTIVGVRMQYCLQALLEKDYGIKCRNAFELGELPLKLNHPIIKESLEGYTLLNLANRFIPFMNKSFSIRQARRMCQADALSDWGAATLSQQQIEAATVRTFLCFSIGCCLYSN